MIHLQCPGIDIRSLHKVKEFYENNLEAWVKEHPKKYILIDRESTMGDNPIVNFYETERDLKQAISKKYGKDLGRRAQPGSAFGVPFLANRIPSKVRYEECPKCRGGGNVPIFTD